MPRYAELADASFLRAHYLDAGLSTAAIARLVGCTQSAVVKALARHHIPGRPAWMPAPSSKRANA